jgi:hypothetical protein
MSTLLDRETVEALADEPELLALADALVSTKPRRRRHLPYVAAAAIAAGLTLTFLAPWSGSGAPTLARALAALGPRPVVHVVAQTRLRGAVIRTETWYDTERRLLHEKVRRNGKLADDFVARTFTPVGSGRLAVLFPAARGRHRWIAPPGPIWLTGLPSPELMDFTTRYRADLRSGQARVVGHGRVAGRDIVWLEFRRPIWTIRIAVDATTYEPVLLRTLVGRERRQRGADTRILVAETVPRAAADFRAPRRSMPSPLPRSCVFPRESRPLCHH